VKEKQALLAVFLAGAGLATQAYVNGQLGSELGSPLLAAVVNQAVGLSCLLAFAVASGALARAWRRMRAGARFRWWHVAVCANGALFLTVASAAAPKVGVALLTVAVVSGQTGGSLVVDRIGLSPSGPQRLTAARLAGVGLAVAAVTLAAAGTHRDLHLTLLALAVVAGAGMALVQAALGHMTRITGEPVAAASISFAVGGAVIVVVALIVTGGQAPNGWGTPPELCIAGAIGACVAVAMARTVRTLGVLRLTLALVAGQSVGGVVFDLIAPAAGESVTLRTLVSVGLTFLAVIVSGAGAQAADVMAKRSGRKARAGMSDAGSPPVT
jgi:bacterial/archaeal transporter family-2 protein